MRVYGRNKRDFVNDSILGRTRERRGTKKLISKEIHESVDFKSEFEVEKTCEFDMPKKEDGPRQFFRILNRKSTFSSHQNLVR